MRLLAALTDNPGEVVSREELQEQLWSDGTTIDFETGLNAAVRKLREALGDDPGNPQYIETIPKRGYRFVFPISPSASKVDSISSGESSGKIEPVITPTHAFNMQSPVAPAIGSKRTSRAWIIFAAGLALSSMAVTLVRMDVLKIPELHGSVPSIHSIAVLPLQNLSADSTQEYLSDGITDALITDMARIDGLKVTSRTSTLRYKQTQKPLLEIARELHVDGIIEGTVQRSGDRVRVTAQLIFAPADRHIWANGYERDMRDIFALQRDITEDIAHQIRLRLIPGGSTERTQPLPMDPKAVEAYLQGNYHTNRQGKGFGDVERRMAIQNFEQSIAADPSFAPAYHALALAHQNLLLGSKEDVVASQSAAEKAVEIDPNSSARVTVAVLKWIPNFDWKGAENDLRRIRQVSPNSPTARSALCVLLIVEGQKEEGLKECRIAQRLDPLDDDAALGFYFAREYDDSIAMLQDILQGDNDGRLRCELFPAFAMKQMYKEMIEELQQCYALYGFTQNASNIQRAYAESGYLGAVRQWARETEHLQDAHQAFLPGFLAEAYTILGDKDRAFYWLQQAYEHKEMVGIDGGLIYIGAEPMYDPLRSDPRFDALLRRVGLAP